MHPVIAVKKLPRFVAHTYASWPALDGSAKTQMTSKHMRIQPQILEKCKRSPVFRKNLRT